MAHTRQGESSNKPQGETARGSRPRAQASASAPQHSSGRLETLQQMLGNQGVLRRMEAGLRINDVNDPSEREADRVAQAVMASTNSEAPAPVAPAVTTSPGAAVQRKCAACEEEEEKTQVQRKESSASAPVAAPPIVHQVLASSGEQMDAGTRSFMESRFNHGFGHVRVHTDAKAAQSAQAVNARAYTVGSDLVFAPSNYSPNTSEGRWMLAHELAHVIQQERGGAPPRNPDNPLEQGAERASVSVMEGDIPVSVTGASAAGLARLPADADIPVSLPQDQDVTKLAAEQRQQLIQRIDNRLRYLDAQAGKAEPKSEISIPGLVVESPGGERARLLDWRKKLEAGSGVLVVFGVVRSSPAPTQTRQTSAATTPATTKVAAQQTKSTPQAHPSPPGYAALKPQPHTNEEIIAAASVTPQKKQEQFKHLEAPPLSPDVTTSWLGGTTGEQSKSGGPGTATKSAAQAHTSAPGYAALKPQPHTFEDTIKAANVTPGGKQGGEGTKHLEAPPPSAEAAKAFLNKKPGEVTLPDGRTVVIPPKPPFEITEDWEYGIAKANVQGVRAEVVRSLNSELQAIESNADSSRSAAQRFLSEWPIMRRLADLAAGAEPPSDAIWLEVDKYLQQSHEAIRRGDLEKAVELTKLARGELRSARWTWYLYKERNLGGAEDIKAGAEGTRDAAKYTLIVLATAASGGTALAVATAAGVAIDLADVAARAALGEKINWGEVTAEVAVQIVMAKFGGRFSSGLFQAAEQKAAAQGLSLTNKILSEAVKGVVTGAEARTLGAFVRGVYVAASPGKPAMTWEQFIDQVTDPKSVLIDIILGVGKGIQAKQLGTGKTAKEKVPPEQARKGENLEETLSKERTLASEKMKKGETRPVDKKRAAEGYDLEVDVEVKPGEKHTYRHEKIEGTWCRFSDVAWCGHALGPEADKAIAAARQKYRPSQSGIPSQEYVTQFLGPEYKAQRRFFEGDKAGTKYGMSITDNFSASGKRATVVEVKNIDIEREFSKGFASLRDQTGKYLSNVPHPVETRYWLFLDVRGQPLTRSLADIAKEVVHQTGNVYDHVYFVTEIGVVVF